MTGRPQTELMAIEPSPMYGRVQLMFAQLFAVIASAIALFFAPEPLGFALFAAFYGALVWRETRIGFRNRQSRALLALALINLALWPWMDAIGLYAPAAMFAILLGFSVASMLRGRPMTMIYGDGCGHVPTHWRTSALWLAVFAIGLAFSLLVFQHLWLAVGLPAILIVGAVGTLWLQLHVKAGALEPGKRIRDGDFDYVELEKTGENIDAFYFHFCRETLFRNLDRAQRDARGGLAAMVRDEQSRDASVIADRRYFTVQGKGEIIGAISFVPMPDGWEMTEIGRRLNLGDIRDAYGAIGLFDHFSIIGKRRHRPGVIQPLLRMAIEACFEADCSFAVTFAFADIAPLYRKVGFVPLLDEDAPSVRCGAPLQPMMLNVAHAAICEFESMHRRGYGRDDFLADTNLGERFFKRQTLRSLFTRTPAWRFDIGRSIGGLSSACASEASRGLERAK